MFNPCSIRGKTTPALHSRHAFPASYTFNNSLFLPAGVLGVPAVNGNFSVGTSVRVQWNNVLVRRYKVGNTACPVAFRYMVGR